MNVSGLRRLLPLCLLVVLGVGGGARAQTAGAAPDLNLLALDWARGHYGSPLVCDVGGSPVRAIRSVLISPAPSRDADRGPANRIQFPDPEARGATRCFSELGADEPLVDGALTVFLPGRSRPDTARYEFQAELRREEGFRFEIRAGKLSIKGWAPGESDPRVVDFTGGHARLRAVQHGSDSERLLRGFASKRKLTLDLEAPDGTTLHFPLFEATER
ncbi:MAG: hypothetical protein IT386_06595 [Deltaproteobacteria bacterium]|nr:hypothetical protein [Deltaproteobacteria bacterium]